MRLFRATPTLTRPLPWPYKASYKLFRAIIWTSTKEEACGIQFTV